MLQAATQSSLLVRDVEGTYRDAHPEEVLQAALGIIGQRVTRGTPLSSPTTAREFVTLRLGALEHEVFAVLFLDAQNRLIEYSELFRGTATQTSVYPREVVKEALVRNAVAVILAHNHPSGSAEPSRADEYLTKTLKTALALVDVRVLDHIVVGGATIVSFAERGLL